MWKKRRGLVVLFLLVFAVTSFFSGCGSGSGGGSSDETARTIAATSDGGYVVAGGTGSSDDDITFGGSTKHAGYDGWVVKLDGTGQPGVAPNIEWQICLGGSGSECIYSIAQTADGGYIMSEYTNTNNNGDVSVFKGGGADYWIVRLDNTGSPGIRPGISWAKCFGGTGTNDGYSLSLTSDGGIIVCGRSNSTDFDIGSTGPGNHGNYDCWVVKLNSATPPSIDWEYPLGGNNIDFAEYDAITQTQDGGYVVSARTRSNNDGDVPATHGGWDYWITKLDNTGAPGTRPAKEWSLCFGGTGTDYAYPLCRTSDGGYLVGGYTTSSDLDVTFGGSTYHAGWDSWIIRLSAAGALVWQKCYGGSGNDISVSLLQTSDGGYISTGITWSSDYDSTENHGGDDFFVVKTDSSGY